MWKLVPLKLGLAFGAFALVVCAQSVEPRHAVVKLVEPARDKNFYLLSTLERSAEVLGAVKQSAALDGLLKTRMAALDASKSCALDVGCMVATFKWTDKDAREAGAALGALYGSSAAVRSWVDELKLSGMYVRYNAQPGAQFLASAWEDCYKGLNHALDVYALGGAPRYPDIDSITYDPKALGYQRVLQSLIELYREDRASFVAFYQPSLRLAMEAMALNYRDEAGRLEPMESGENAAAYKRVKSVNWSRFAYSAIIVLGSGNDRPGVALSPAGRVRDEIAAKRYREGKAPFVIVSGGYVHPSLTPYAEALEMKKDLMTRFHIPADAILIDPHARHTTTNIRNAARLIYRYGMPFDKKALVTTDLSHSATIDVPSFAERNTRELGYVPYKLAGRPTPFDVEIYPAVESLHMDPQDPLDP